MNFFSYFSRARVRSTGFIVLTGVLVVAVAVLAYSFLVRNIFSPPVDASKANVPPGQVIQIDLLNGCGVAGAAQKFTGYLRSRGYDVVEMKNYKTFDVKESLIIDRTGDLETAQRVGDCFDLCFRICRTDDKKICHRC